MNDLCDEESLIPPPPPKKKMKGRGRLIHASDVCDLHIH